MWFFFQKENKAPLSYEVMKGDSKDLACLTSSSIHLHSFSSQKFLCPTSIDYFMGNQLRFYISRIIIGDTCSGTVLGAKPYGTEVGTQLDEPGQAGTLQPLTPVRTQTDIRQTFVKSPGRSPPGRSCRGGTDTDPRTPGLPRARPPPSLTGSAAPCPPSPAAVPALPTAPLGPAGRLSLPRASATAATRPG